MNFLIFLLASIGFTHLIVDSEIFDRIKSFIVEKINPFLKGNFIKLSTLLLEASNCYKCMGTWVGWFLSPIFTISYFNYDNTLLSGFALIFIFFTYFMFNKLNKINITFLILNLILYFCFIDFNLKTFEFLIITFGLGFISSFFSMFIFHFNNYLESATLVNINGSEIDDN